MFYLVSSYIDDLACKLYNLFQTLDSILNVEMMKQKKPEEIKQVTKMGMLKSTFCVTFNFFKLMEPIVVC